MIVSSPVAPGATGELTVTVQNLTNLLDQVELRVEGIDPEWVQVVPPILPVFAQGQAKARVLVSPPLDPARVLAGAYRFRVVATTQADKQVTAAQ